MKEKILKEEIIMLESIFNSVDPSTGELIKGIDVQTKKSLLRLIDKLEKYQVKNFKKESAKEIYKNAGEKWTKSDDLLLEKSFKSGSSISELSIRFGRTMGSIKSRIVKIGLYKNTLEVPEKYI